jgi:tRNA (guanine37-N1)-methyltransferase
VLSVEVLTLFPRMIAAPLEESILGKAREKGLLRLHVSDIREFAEGKHRVTDDVPYGGGAGMVMKPEPLVAAIEAAKAREPGARVVLLSRYEGVDERVLEWIDEEISLGDFVITGGEFAALAVVDAVARLLPGVLGNSESTTQESFEGEGLLEGPQYTRPPVFRGHRVPEVLLSGDHAKIAAWRREQALERTRDRRPDLLKSLKST